MLPIRSSKDLRSTSLPRPLFPRDGTATVAVANRDDFPIPRVLGTSTVVRTCKNVNKYSVLIITSYPVSRNLFTPNSIIHP